TIGRAGQGRIEAKRNQSEEGRITNCCEIFVAEEWLHPLISQTVEVFLSRVVANLNHFLHHLLPLVLVLVHENDHGERGDERVDRKDVCGDVEEEMLSRGLWRLPEGLPDVH
ncbi:hypothetical protein PENTCL1PPCAC_13867, partial [Pristionchus entomophagus]